MLKLLFHKVICRPHILILVAVTTALVSFATSSAQTEAQKEQATDLNNEAVELTDQGKDREALELFTEALTLDPGSEAILYNRGETYNSLARYREALQDASELVRRHSNNAEYLCLRAETFRNLRQPDKARADFHKAISLEPDNPKVIDSYLGFLSQNEDRGEFMFQSLRRVALQSQTEANLEANQNFALPTKFLGFVGEEGHWRPALLPGKGELRLYGKITGIDVKRGMLQVEVAAFGLPNGRFRVLPETKAKSVYLGRLEGTFGNWGALPSEALNIGDGVVLLGKDSKAHFQVRRYFVVVPYHSPSSARVDYFEASKFKIPEEDVPDSNEEPIGKIALSPRKQHESGSAAFLAKDEKGTILFVPAASGRNSRHKSAMAPQAPQRDPEIVQLLAGLGKTINWDAKTATKFTIQSRHTGAGYFADREVVALRVSESPSAFPLAKQLPKRGEIVYQTGIYDIAPTTIPAVVVWADAHRLVVRGTYGDEDGRRPGGAVLNKAGEVLGMVLETDEEMAFVAPVAALRRVLNSAPILEK